MGTGRGCTHVGPCHCGDQLPRRCVAAAAFTPASRGACALACARGGTHQAPAVHPAATRSDLAVRLPGAPLHPTLPCTDDDSKKKGSHGRKRPAAVNAVQEKNRSAQRRFRCVPRQLQHSGRCQCQCQWARGHSYRLPPTAQVTTRVTSAAAEQPIPTREHTCTRGVRLDPRAASAYLCLRPSG